MLELERADKTLVAGRGGDRRIEMEQRVEGTLNPECKRIDHTVQQTGRQQC